ncbi:MAG: nucleoside phosphorylase [Deltaproteobacteria bacterium]|nr:nucleoside phosphorylase [Deltaproteobacteria bacterium]
MTLEENRVVIESRKGSKEKDCEAIAIMVSCERDLRRFCRLATPVADSARTAYNARLLDVVHANRSITIAGPILGAPQAVLVLEKLITLGSRVIIVFGWCGSLQSDLTIGDRLLPSSARSEEGTSCHYPSNAAKFLPDTDLFGSLQDYCAQNGFSVRAGPIWTTDAPLRETVDKVSGYGEEGFLAVEMEMSALFHVAAYRNVRLAGLLVVSDELFTLKWRPGFRSTRFNRACRQASDTLLDFCSSLPPSLLK